MDGMTYHRVLTHSHKIELQQRFEDNIEFGLGVATCYRRHQSLPGLPGLPCLLGLVAGWTLSGRGISTQYQCLLFPLAVAVAASQRDKTGVPVQNVSVVVKSVLAFLLNPNQ